MKFQGYFTNKEGEKSIFCYIHTYIYTLYYIKNILEIHASNYKEIFVREITPVFISLSNRLNEYVWGSSDFEKNKPRYLHIIGPHYDDISGYIENEGKICEDIKRPWQIAVFKRGLEGICWTGDSQQYLWDDGIFKGKSKFLLTKKDKRSINIILSPLNSYNPTNCGKKLKFQWYIVLPNIPETCRKKYYEVAVGTCPFPEKELIEKLVKRGVNLIRIHDDTEGRKTLIFTGMMENILHLRVKKTRSLKIL
ncbi:MAG: hypothetical protein ACPL3Q_09860 [Candidatus Ratteibacteria bacterium]